MSNILELAEEIWRNSEEVEFGETENWNEDSLLHSWFQDNSLEDQWTSQAPGWYWFICQITYDELEELETPLTLPQKACNFGDVSQRNRIIFGDDLLCRHNDTFTVIYNGHRSSVSARIRIHFSLNDNSTGALGIHNYPLSQKSWRVRYFTSNQINRLDAMDQATVRRLIESESGREAIESSWRVKYGWPILCKQ